MFIVQQPRDVPCPQAKRVQPGEVPPIRPEYLPRPYAWEVFQEQQNPNNPYNLVDRARTIRESGAPPESPPNPADPRSPAGPRVGAPPPPPVTPSGPAPLPQVASAPPPRPALPAPRSLDLALSDDEKRDLALIVELSQKRAPAMLSGAGGGDDVVLRLAHSQAFESRVYEAATAAGRPLAGAVVLFSAVAGAPGAFHGNLAFAQAHTAFHPERDDPAQFGVFDGTLGALGSGERVLGYVVLPAALDPGQPLDVYWNDRRLVTTLRP